MEGCYKSSENKFTATLSKKLKDKYKYKIKIFSEVVERGPYQPWFWLVRYNTGKWFFCTEEALNTCLHMYVWMYTYVQSEDIYVYVHTVLFSQP